MSWPRYVEGTTSISRLMHKQTYLTLATRDYQRWIYYFILNYYRNDYIIIILTIGYRTVGNGTRCTQHSSLSRIG